MRTHLLSILTVCLFVAGMVACDVTADQNYDFKQGNTLAIVGPTEVAIPQDTTTIADTTDVTSVTVSYYSQAFTIKKDYKWTVEGSAQKDSVYRNGGFIDITFSNATGSDTTTTTLSVDDGEYTGSITIKAFRQSNQAAGL